MSDDIVTRLLAVLHNDRSVELMNQEAAEEINDLRFQLRCAQDELDGSISRRNTLLDENEDLRIGADNLEKDRDRLIEESERLAKRNALLVIEIENLRKERDEARQRLCEELLEVEGHPFGWKGARGAEGIAQRLGWDCFKEKP